MRHTMGQDWGGRKKVNPDNAPRISKEKLLLLAKDKGLNIKRDFHSCNWLALRKSDGEWYTIGSTNYLAYRYLQNPEALIFT